MPTNQDRRLHPETRTVRALLADGWVADKAVVKQGKFSSDWAGVADVIAFRPAAGNLFGCEVLLVQATDNTHFANRVDKLVKHPATALILRARARLEVWAWYRDRDEPKIQVMEPGILVVAEDAIR